MRRTLTQQPKSKRNSLNISWNRKPETRKENTENRNEKCLKSLTLKWNNVCAMLLLLQLFCWLLCSIFSRNSMLCSVVLCSVQLRVYMDLVCMASAHGIVVAHRIRSLWVQWTYNESGSCSCKREEWKKNRRTEELNKQQRQQQQQENSMDYMCAALRFRHQWKEKWLENKTKNFESRQNRHIILKKEDTIAQWSTQRAHFNGLKSLYCVHPDVFSTTHNKPLNYIKCSCSRILWGHISMAPNSSRQRWLRQRQRQRQLKH